MFGSDRSGSGVNSASGVATNKRRPYLRFIEELTHAHEFYSLDSYDACMRSHSGASGTVLGVDRSESECQICSWDCCSTVLDPTIDRL